MTDLSWISDNIVIPDKDNTLIRICGYCYVKSNNQVELKEGGDHIDDVYKCHICSHSPTTIVKQYQHDEFIEWAKQQIESYDPKDPDKDDMSTIITDAIASGKKSAISHKLGRYWFSNNYN